jgi:hypothetical protein
VIGYAKKVAKEKEFVLEDGAADRAAGVVINKSSVRPFREVVARVDAIVLHVLEDRAMEVVGSRLQRYIHHATNGAAELSLEVVGRDVDTLDGSSGGHKDDMNARALIVVNAFDLVKVHIGRLAVRVN